MAGKDELESNTEKWLFEKECTPARVPGSVQALVRNPALSPVPENGFERPLDQCFTR
jgi:hypothetical protein